MKNLRAMVVTMLDEVAWLFNLRGSDIDFNPGRPLIVLAGTLTNIYAYHLSLLCVCHCHGGHRYSFCR